MPNWPKLIELKDLQNRLFRCFLYEDCVNHKLVKIRDMLTTCDLWMLWIFAVGEVLYSFEVSDLSTEHCLSTLYALVPLEKCDQPRAAAKERRRNYRRSGLKVFHHLLVSTN